MSLDDRLIAVDWTDALDIFKPASDLSASTPAISKLAASVSLEDLKSSGVRVEWYEAVAIAQETCRAIIESGDSIGPAKIEPHEVSISATGGVSVASNGPRSAPAAVKSLGNLLSEILPAADFMILRVKLVAKAISSPPFYSSVEEFSHALAYYERPNRTQLIKAVYDRWRSIEAAPVPQEAPPAVEFLPSEGFVEEASDRPRDVRLPLVAALALVAIVGAAILVFRVIGSSTESTPNAPSRAVDATNPHLPTVLKSSESVNLVPSPRVDGPPLTPSIPRPRPKVKPVPSRRVQSAPPTTAALRPRRTVNPDPVKPGPLLPANRVLGSPTTANPVASPSPEAVQPTSTAPAPTAPAVGRVVDPTSAPSRTPEVLNTPVTPAIERVIDRLIDPMIYSSRDTDVVRPLVIYPQFLAGFGPGLLGDDRAKIEVIVNESGTVDSATVQTPPRSVGEYDLVTTSLSAVKSWRFQPALKDGHPVKYRMLIPLGNH